MPNQFNVDYAFPGLCSLCHDEIADFEGSRQIRAGIFRPIIKRLKGIAREADIKLDDGSVMHIALCKRCYNDFKPEDVQELMESEINGWQHEVDEVVFWEEEKKIDHMKRYSERFVTDRVDKEWNKAQKLMIKKPRKDKLKVRTE